MFIYNLIELKNQNHYYELNSWSWPFQSLNKDEWTMWEQIILKSKIKKHFLQLMCTLFNLSFKQLQSITFKNGDKAHYLPAHIGLVRESEEE